MERIYLVSRYTLFFQRLSFLYFVEEEEESRPISFRISYTIHVAKTTFLLASVLGTQENSIVVANS